MLTINQREGRLSMDTMETQSYVVIENTPGYMPENDDPLVTDSYREAVEYANSLADELEEAGYECDRSWASGDNYYAIRCKRSDMVAPDLGRVIEVVRDES